MSYLIASLAILCVGGVAAFAARRNPALAGRIGCGTVLAGVLAAVPSFFTELEWLTQVWIVLPILSAEEAAYCGLFRVPILILAAAGAVHATGYLKGHGFERSGTFWLFYNLTVAAMLSVTMTTVPLYFLFAWELMGMMSFALVSYDYRSDASRKAAWIYLAACHAGAAFLILMFLFPVNAPTLFVLAVLGFGLKIGFLALHVWLPEAHPAAPAPVSSLMSGAMIPLGFYGIFQFGILPEVEYYVMYGWTFLGLGLVGSFFGVLFALPQNNLKRLLAYSSIENMGIISMGFGLGFLGLSLKQPPLVVCGFGGGFLHILNHAFLKGGLFLGAGSVQKAAGTLEIDRMGGLLKRMPVSGTLFTLNSFGICGLPPFNGFVGEFLIYLAAFRALACGSLPIMIGAFFVIVVLALVGGLAGAVFCKAVGGVFLGEPRTENASQAKEVCRAMTVPVIVLFIGSCLLIGFAPYLMKICGYLAFREWAVPQGNHSYLQQQVQDIAAVLARMGWLLLVVVWGFIGLWLWRFRVLTHGRELRRSGTWDCAFAKPTARMEYTGSAFAQPLVDFFHFLLHPLKKIVEPKGLFPRESSINVTVEDGMVRCLWQPLIGVTGRIAAQIRGLQSGYLHFYILLVVIALLIMLGVGLLPWNGEGR